MLNYIYRAVRKAKRFLSRFIDKQICLLILKGNNIQFSSIKTSGYPYVNVFKGGKISIGKEFSMHNIVDGNPIGVYQKCTLVVYPGCSIRIGDNVGISQTALIAMADIQIQNNVKIGGGTCIYTSDFHSLDPQTRTSKNDMKQRKCAPIVIGDNVFIGAHCIILKGVTIGQNSIIGAGSVVTKSIPANQIWAGNPAKFIRNIETL